MNKPLKKRLYIGGATVVLVGALIALFFDAFYGGTHFRTMQDKIAASENVDLTGLRELKASGGRPPRFVDLEMRLRHVKEEKILVDAMDGFHGYFYGIPTNFFGYTRPNPAFHHLLRRLLVTGTTEMRPELVIPEPEEAKKHGFRYVHFLIGSKFVTDPKTVDAFLAFLESVPDNVWLHFHCAQGRGRTSSMIVMLDILKNAPKVSLEDIVKRQHLLGAPNLLDAKLWKNGSYTQQQLDDRKKFIQDFYEFICQRKAGGTQLWSEWIQARQ
jgi:hypothetical protein